jgi:hypothetical protein
MAEAAPLWHRLSYTRLRDMLRGRFDGSLDWRRPIADSGLPRELASVVIDTVLATHLWRREKIDVAQDLVSHFREGLAAGQSAEQLARSFGNPRQSARLIRRAKRRCRPWSWKLVRGLELALAILVVGYFLLSLRMLFDRPSVNTDYLAILNREATTVPETERAWPLYRDALLAMGVRFYATENVPLPLAVVGDAAPGDESALESASFLREHASSIESIRQAASRRGLGYVTTSTDYATMSSKDRQLYGVPANASPPEPRIASAGKYRYPVVALFPSINALRCSARILAQGARHSVSEGDAHRTLADVIALFGISEQVQETPSPLGVFSADEIQSSAIRLIHDVLVTRPDLWTNDQLAQLAHRAAVSRIDWRRGIQGDRANFYDIVQRIFTDDGNGNGRLALRVTDEQNLFDFLISISGRWHGQVSTLSDNRLAGWVMPAANMVVASRQQTVALYNQLTDETLEKLETPLWEQPDSPRTSERIRALENEHLAEFRYMLVFELINRFYDSWQCAVARSDGVHDGLFVGIALELYHREHGKWPSSLAELSPRWLPQVPVDRINGTPLGYRIVDGRPLVYSLGVDSDDDSGRLPADCNGAASAYRVQPAYTVAHPTDYIRSYHDGDWVIWSAVKEGQ